MKAIICSKLRYPRGDAGSIRHEVLAKMLENLGYDVIVAALGPRTNQKIINSSIPYVSFRYGSHSKKDKIKSRLLYARHLQLLVSEVLPNLVICDDLGPITSLWLRSYCRRTNIMLIHDSVEWYSPEQFRGGKWSLTYIKKDILNRYIINRDFRVIAISSYLKEYFQSRGIQTTRIPIVISETDLSDEKLIREESVVFTYAGQPGKKDYLGVMLEAFSMLPQELLYRAQIRIIGCTEEQMTAAGIPQDTMDQLREQMVIYGRIPHEQVLELLKTTDFTMLMRSPTQRYAKAGFPTKVVESLSSATPVICNLTSDLDLYLHDGENSLIVPDCTAEAMAQKLTKAISLSLEDRRQMCYTALKTAEDKFLFKTHIDQLENLLR